LPLLVLLFFSGSRTNSEIWFADNVGHCDVEVSDPGVADSGVSLAMTEEYELEVYNFDRGSWTPCEVKIILRTTQSAETRDRKDFLQVTRLPKFELTPHTRVVETSEGGEPSTSCGVFQILEVRAICR